MAPFRLYAEDILDEDGTLDTLQDAERTVYMAGLHPVKASVLGHTDLFPEEGVDNMVMVWDKVPDEEADQQNVDIGCNEAEEEGLGT